MEFNLFSKIEKTKEEKNETSGFYDEIVVQRNRPALPEEEMFIEKVNTTDNDDGNIKNIEEQQMQENDKNKVIYTFDEAMKASTEYFGGEEMAAKVWIGKYSLKDSNDNIYELTPDDMHHRIASELARIEKKYPNPLSEETIYELIKKFKYIIPQGSPMSGIGNNYQIVSLSNCFVIGNNGDSDSYGGILKIDQEQVQLMKRRGGVGHDLSHIRPYGSHVKNSAISSTGIVPFMERYSNSTREVAQDGRRGALMLSISIKHPDAEHFINAKLEQGKVTGANVSVRIDDEFMQCVINDKPYTQQYPVDSAKPKFKKEIDAKALWGKIVHNAWKSAEPGVLFWDTIIKESVPDCYADLGFKTISTNPCGEIPLCPYDSCRLLAINLYSYVQNPFTNKAAFDSVLFSEHVNNAQRLMDDIIDLETEKIDAILYKIESDPEPYEIKETERKLWENIRKKTLLGRRTGLGITAEADMLAALGLRYGSDDAIKFSTEVHETLAIEAYRSSVIMAKERKPFEVYNTEREQNNPFILRLKESDPDLYEAMVKYGRRNIALLTIAPTGSVSICTQTASGIEPIYSVLYTRRKKVNPNDKDAKVCFTDEEGDSWEEFPVFHPKFVEWLRIKGYDDKEVINYPKEKLDEIIRKSPYYKASANDIDWVSKVKMQGAIQKWVDHSISVTVNIPNDTEEELVGLIYKAAWESGCKGMTIYRDGSRSGVLINKETEEEPEKFTEHHAPSRPIELEADVVRFQNNNEKWIALVGLFDERPYEIFTGKADDLYLPPWLLKGKITRRKDANRGTVYDFQYIDKQGYEQKFDGISRTFDIEFWNYAKLISGIMRHGMPLPNIVKLISKLDFKEDTINTWKNGVIRALKKYVPEGTKAPGEKCPQCGTENSLVYKEGCIGCQNCDYSKCG